jgi:hypothetical protein
MKFNQVLLKDREKFDWRTEVEKVAKPEIVYDQHFEAAENYLQDTIKSLQG